MTTESIPAGQELHNRHGLTDIEMLCIEHLSMSKLPHIALQCLNVETVHTRDQLADLLRHAAPFDRYSAGVHLRDALAQGNLVIHSNEVTKYVPPKPVDEPTVSVASEAHIQSGSAVSAGT